MKRLMLAMPLSANIICILKYVQLYIYIVLVNYGKCYGTGFVTKNNLPYCYYYDNSTNG
jgi:hypothetical protein